MVRQQADAVQVQIRKYLRADADLALRLALMFRMRRLADIALEGQRGLFRDLLDGESLPRLVQVDERTTSFRGDHLQRACDHGVAIAPRCSEHVAHQTV